MGLAQRIAALLGISAFAKAPPKHALSLEDEFVKRIREQFGGNLQPIPWSQTRWYLSDLEAAEHNADQGHLVGAARLMRAARKDGVVAGVLSTRTKGLVQLPKRFVGEREAVEALELGHDESRSVFDEMCPANELALLAGDGDLIGVGVGELVEVQGRDFPLFVRHDPEFLTYRWSENQWYFRSVAGEIPITPGDGRWVLHVPGGRTAPWQHGLWRAVGRAYIRKEHAAIHKDNWIAKLANPARVAVHPPGASETQKLSWFRRVMAWGINTVFSMPPGYDVKLLESNGRGHESFDKTIADQNDEFKMAIAGQLVTSDGGAGFQNSDIHRSIRADLIQSTADSLAYTINTQILPPWQVARWGDAAFWHLVSVQWDTTPPKDRATEANAMVSVATAIEKLSSALDAHGLHLDVEALATQFGIPLASSAADGVAGAITLDQALGLARTRGLRANEDSVRRLLARMGIELEAVPEDANSNQAIPLAPTDIAKVVRAKEARGSLSLPAFGDERDDLTITELAERGKADAEADAEVEVAEKTEDVVEEAA